MKVWVYGEMQGEGGEGINTLERIARRGYGAGYNVHYLHRN